MGALDGLIARRRDDFGFFTGGIWSWAPIWLPELFPTRMRGTAVAFCFNAPRWISCAGPLIAGTLIVSLGGYGRAATIVGLFFIVGVIVAPFLPRPTASRCRTRCRPRIPRRQQDRDARRPLSQAGGDGRQCRDVDAVTCGLGDQR